MKFYDRKPELEELARIRNLASGDHSRMTVVTGRRRIGKTSLILKSAGDAKMVYLFIARKNEASLCDEFSHIIAESLNTFVPERIISFKNLFQYLMELGLRSFFTLILDEFQEFDHVNPSIYSDMQNIWDQYKDRSHVNLVLSGSVYSMMQKIFQDAKEPLFGRADNIIKLQAFGPTVLKEIMRDYTPSYHSDDLLAFYAFTGGIPKYIELFCESGGRKPLSLNSMIDFMIRDNSPFLEEGKYLLIEEFGKNYGMYFSILGAVSGGINTQPAIGSILGEKSIGGQLKHLIEDYNILVRRRPLLAKEGAQSVRYEIADNFLQFWFNYIDRYRAYIEIKNFAALKAIIKADYTTYSGKILERYFRQQLAETGAFRAIGSWWTPKDDQKEIDIVALKLEKGQAEAIEVKRQKKNYRPALLEAKVEYMKQKILPGYDIICRCLSLEDM
jgi:AAA+ ATPase superfamily predicted ATPase